MPIPGQSLTIRDPGLGVVEQSDNAFVFIGCAEKGDLNTVKAFSSPAAVTDHYGQGALAEDLCHTLMIAGGPVYGCRVAATIAGAASSVSKVSFASSSGTVAVAGAAFDRYEATIEIVSTGTLGAGRFRYTLDRGRTWSEELTIPGSGTYLIPNTNLTLTFAPGGGPVYFERGDKHSFTSTAPHYGTTEVGLAFDAIATYLSTAPSADFDAVVLTGRNATGSAAATLFGAVSTRLSGMAAMFRYMRAIMDAGSGDTKTNAKTALNAVADKRINPVYGDADIVSAKGFAGYGAPRRTALTTVAARAAASLISTDLARYASGSLPGVLAITHDEYLSPELDDAKITTLRTHPSSSGYYITNARLKSEPGSDFLYWQHGRCMDVACRTTVKVQQNFLSMGLLTKDGGQIDPSEAARLEAIARRPLEDALLLPKNVEGRAGHVSAFKYVVDRANNLLTSQTVQTEIAIRPLGYAKFIVTQIGFATSVG